MNVLPSRLLLCTNGSPHSLPALEYGCWLAGALGRPVDLLGIVEREAARAEVQAAVERTAAALRARGIEANLHLRRGRAEVAISEHAAQAEALTVVGPLGRPWFQRLARGSSFRELLALIEAPILLVPQVRLPLQCILLCTGGLSHAFDLERLGIDLARQVGAALVLLHVVEPVSLDYPLAREIDAHWRNLLETDTPPARNLRGAVQMAEEAGVSVQVRIRRGAPVHEILQELRSGGYDLVGLGSPYSAHSLRHLFMPNVTADVAEAARCPVLSVRHATAAEPGASPAHRATLSGGVP